MKQLILLLFLLPLVTIGQNYNLTDTTFKKGSIFSPDILYDLDKATLRPESEPILDSIAKFLMKNKSLVIEVGVHTDSRSGKQEMKMSRLLYESRAKSVVDYLVKKGINPLRLIYKGYGSVHLLVSDAEIAKLKTKDAIEKAHQKNRRTEFKIVRTDFQE
jgi:outer membrane protein OmpA-like peptidoglycan-associated protein